MPLRAQLPGARAFATMAPVKATETNPERSGVVIERGVVLIGAERISFGRNVYLGHETVLEAGSTGSIHIDDDTWVGQRCVLRTEGRLHVGPAVGVGPFVHLEGDVHVEADVDIGVATRIIGPSVIGREAQIGAGAEVRGVVAPYAVVAGTPAHVLRFRP